MRAIVHANSRACYIILQSYTVHILDRSLAHTQSSTIPELAQSRLIIGALVPISDAPTHFNIRVLDVQVLRKGSETL